MAYIGEYLYTWRVTSSNQISMLSWSVSFDGLSGQTELEDMLILMLGKTRTHCTTIVMIIDGKCRDQELFAHNVTKHVMVAV